MIYLTYAVLAAAVVGLAVRLSYYVDVLDRKTNLSGAFIGGVLLAAVTSLPELFTALTAVLALDKPQLVAGDILGSNIFNLGVIGGLVLVFHHNYRHATLSKSHRTTLGYSLVMYALVLIAILYPFELAIGPLHFHVMSAVILIVYGINAVLMKGDDSAQNENEDDCPLSLGQVIVRFLLNSVALVGVSILLTHTTDLLAQELQLGATVAGAIFLGVATSLPELSASISLVRRNNFNASFGNIVGSNLFNFTILCFADFLHTGGAIYQFEPQTLNLLGFGALASLLAILMIMAQKKPAWARVCGALILVAYVLSIALSM